MEEIRGKLKIIYICFLILIFSGTFFSESMYIFEDLQLNPFDYARITDVEYRAVVSDNEGDEGKVIITERLTFDVHAASPEYTFWELWRDLPEDEIDGVKVYYKVNSVKQILKDGTEIVYEESPRLYWEDEDYVRGNPELGPGKWFHSPGPYNESSRDYECVFFYIDDVYREEMVFEIEYEMYNASLKYNDCSDLYLALYSGSTITKLESFEAEILFPNDKMPSKGNYEVFTYGTNSHTFPVEESADKNPGYYTFSFELDEEDLKFKPYNQYIEFDLVAYGDDKHIFTQHAPDNYYTGDDVLEEIWEEQEAYANEPAKAATRKAVVLGISLLATAGVMFFAFKIDKYIKGRHYFCDPVEIQYFREIPGDLDPNFAGALVHCKHKAPKDDSGVYSAILLSLARKEYIELEEIYNDVLIKIKKKKAAPPVTPSAVANEAYQAAMEAEPALEDLTTCEALYFNLLVSHATMGEISMSTLQWRVASDTYGSQSFVKNMASSVTDIGVSRNYFQKLDYKQPQKELRRLSVVFIVLGILFLIPVNIISCFTRMDLAFGAFILFGIACIVAGVMIRKQSGKYVLLTSFGEEEYAKWRGLYNFLNSETLMEERTFVEVELWEKYLIYASAFGIAEKVSEAIGLRCPELAVERSSVLRNGSYRHSNFHSSSRSVHSSVRSSGSFGGGGGGGGFGYGGGGRGGGGGGGGH